MHLQHHASRILDTHREETLEDEHDELHRRVIVVQHQDFVIGRLLGLGTRARRDAGLDLVEAIVAVRAGRHADQCRTPQTLKYGSQRKRGKSAVSNISVKKWRPPRYWSGRRQSLP